MKHPTYKKGISLVETLIYMAFLTVFMIVIINGIYTFTTSYRVVRATKAIENSAIISLDRLGREIRNASSVDTTASVWGATGTSTQALVLVSGATTTVFRVCGASIHLYVNSGTSTCAVAGDQGPLTLSGVTVSTFGIQLIATSTKQAVKIDLTLTTIANTIAKSKNFHTTAIVRGLY